MEKQLVYKITSDTSGLRKGTADLDKFGKATKKVDLSGFFGGISGIATGSQISGLTSQISSASSALGALPGPAGAAAASIALIATAAVGAGIGLFKLAEYASEFGSEIYDASQQTGLSAETLTSMKVAAEQASSSLEDVVGAIGKFSKNVGEAALGSEKAATALQRLGVDPKKAIKDLDGALGIVFKRIASLPPGIVQTRAAMDAFGKSGAKLIPFIRSFDGDLPGLIAKMKELGVVMSDKDAAAADQFGDQMDTLKAQLKAVGFVFGKELMPVFLQFANATSAWLAANKGQIASWASSTATAVRGIVTAFSNLVDFYNNNSTAIRIMLGIGTFGASELFRLSATAFGQASDQIMTLGGAPPGQLGGSLFEKMKKKPAGPDGSDYLDDLEAQKKSAEDAKKERERIAKADAAAQISILKNLYDEGLELYQKSVDNQIEILKGGGSSSGFVDAVDQSADIALSRINETGIALAEAERAYDIQEEKTAKERELRRQEQDKRDADTNDKILATQKKAIDAQSDEEKKRNDKSIKESETFYKRYLELNDAYVTNRDAQLQSLVMLESDYIRLHNADLAKQIEEEITATEKLLDTAEDRYEVEHQIYLLKRKLDTQKIKAAKELNEALQKEAEQAIEWAATMESVTLSSGTDFLNKRLGELKDKNAQEHKNDPFGAWKDSWNDFADAIEQRGGGIRSALGTTADIFTDAFGEMANALGSAIEGWALYGDSIGEALQKALASTLAHIAAESAVQAIYSTALGFIRLAQYDFAGAASAFTAAAIFGSIAVGSALGAKAIAGDSFKKGSASDSATATQGSAPEPPPYTRRGNDSAAMGGRSSGSDAGVMARFVAVMERFEAVTPEHVLMSGARRDPRGFGKILERQSERDFGTQKSIARNVGFK